MPLLRSRPLRALIAAGLALVAATARHDSCRDFRFDAARWRAAVTPRSDGRDAETLARAVARCHRFTGASPAAVRRALGPPNGDPWTWVVGEGGFMNITELQLTFGPDGHVRGARVVTRPV